MLGPSGLFLASTSDGLLCLLYLFVLFVSDVRIRSFLFLSLCKPRRNASRCDRTSRQMGNDCSGGDDQSLVEFRAREVLGFRFGLKRYG